MKNFLLPLVMILAVATATAQKDTNRSEKRVERVKQMEPKDIASFQAKKMTLALDLTDKQESQIEEVLFTAATKKKEAMKDLKKRNELSKQEKMALGEARMDEQIAMKRAFKEILNDQQYVEFEKMKMKKGKNRQASREKRRHSRR